MSPLLQVKDLKRHYEVHVPSGLFGRKASLKAVDGVSFSIEKGQTLGLVGESGCGKSTTAKLVLGLIPASAGTVEFDGTPVTARHDARWRALRQRMQMIYQDPLGALDRRLPVITQIAEPFEIHYPQMPAVERTERAAQLMDAVGLRPDMAMRYPHELSGGQRQRVVIARALALEPDLLVCDEPVSALDVSIQAQVLNLLDDLRERTGFAALFISHDLKVVRQMSDQVAVMYLGRIIESGLPEDVFRRPQHPYTKALVSAISDTCPARQTRADRARGGSSQSCRCTVGLQLSYRCPIAQASCRQDVPQLVSSGSHAVACHLVNSGAAPAVQAAE
jgi:peptide/nickel transport system ATP-binding protein